MNETFLGDFQTLWEELLLFFFSFANTWEVKGLLAFYFSASANCIWILEFLKPGAILSLVSLYLLKVLEIVDGTDMLLEWKKSLDIISLRYHCSHPFCGYFGNKRTSVERKLSIVAPQRPFTKESGAIRENAKHLSNLSLLQRRSEVECRIKNSEHVPNSRQLSIMQHSMAVAAVPSSISIGIIIVFIFEPPADKLSFKLHPLYGPKGLSKCDILDLKSNK